MPLNPLGAMLQGGMPGAMPGAPLGAPPIPPQATPAAPMGGMPIPPAGNGMGGGLGAALAGPTDNASPAPLGPQPGGSSPGLMPSAVPAQGAMGGMSVSPAPPNPEPTGSQGAGDDRQRPAAGSQSVPPIDRQKLGALLMGFAPLMERMQQVPGGGVNPMRDYIQQMQQKMAAQQNPDPYAATLQSMMR
jgi:hypothetical protein